MAAAAEPGSCLSLWREENDAQAARWLRVTRSPGPDHSVKRAAQQCQLAFSKLLQKIQGLPVTLPAVPLELTILFNSLLFDIGLSGESDEKLWAKIDHGLSRVLEACAVSGQGLSSEDRWQRLFQKEVPEELHVPLQRLAALQGVLWLTADRLGAMKGLFRLLSTTERAGPSPHRGCKDELLSLLEAWHPPDVAESEPLVVQSARDLKDVLWTSAAFLKGFQDLEAGNLSSSLALLQEAATGLCSKRVLAQIFTLMGCCSLKMGKLQTAMQHLKRSLQVDFAFLPALHQAALLYHHAGLLGAELEALSLLDQALDGSTQVTPESINPHFLIRTELLTCTPRVSAFYGQHRPSEVKHLLAQRCLQAGRASEAVEHYLDLLALLQEGPLHQVSRCGEPASPRIPEVFLEAASALEELDRHQDATAVCEEVVARTSQLIPERLQIELGGSLQEGILGTTGSSLSKSPNSLRQAKEESLRCVLWRAASYLLQGWARARQGEAKEAVSLLSRCLNDLLRVQLVNTGTNSTEVEKVSCSPLEARLLPQVRQLALTGRGSQFLEMGRYKEALMDFQHSLHTCPDSPTANAYLLHTLWKLERRQEAAARWRKLHLTPALLEEETKRPLPLYLVSCMKQMTFPYLDSLMKNLETCAGGSSQGP